ncbi:MAG TPA: hypothetical protein VF223_28635 [Trebonia sp.]
MTPAEVTSNQFDVPKPGRYLISPAHSTVTIRANAQVSIDRYDFGITAYRGLAARTLTVELGIIAHREES